MAWLNLTEELWQASGSAVHKWRRPIWNNVAKMSWPKFLRNNVRLRKSHRQKFFAVIAAKGGPRSRYITGCASLAIYFVLELNIIFGSSVESEHSCDLIVSPFTLKQMMVNNSEMLKCMKEKTAALVTCFVVVKWLFAVVRFVLWHRNRDLAAVAINIFYSPCFKMILEQSLYIGGKQRAQPMWKAYTKHPWKTIYAAWTLEAIANFSTIQCFYPTRIIEGSRGYCRLFLVYWGFGEDVHLACLLWYFRWVI